MSRLILPRRALLKAGAAALITSPAIIGKAAAQIGGLSFPGPGPRGSSAPPNNPSAIFGTNLLAWYNPTVISNSGGVVTSWPDQSNSAANLSNVVGSPAYGATAFNGRPGITLNGTSQYLATASQSIPTGSSTTMAFWLVFNPTATPSPFGRFFTTDSNISGEPDFDGSHSAAPITRNGSTTAIASFADAGATPLASTAIVYGTNYRFSSIFDAVNTTNYIDNVQQAQSANTNPAAWGALGICIGNSITNSGTTMAFGSDFAKGVIAEAIMVKGTITSQNRIDMDAWLKFNNGL